MGRSFIAGSERRPAPSKQYLFRAPGPGWKFIRNTRTGTTVATETESGLDSQVSISNYPTIQISI